MARANKSGMTANKGGKPAPFKKQGKGAFNTVQVKPGDNKAKLANIKQLADNYGAPKQAKTVTVNPKSPNKTQLDNLKAWGSSTGGGGDNPYSGK